jgi:type I restriction enzyme, S subunit
MSELPEGWTETSIKELFVFKYGKGLTQEMRQVGGGVRVYGSNGVVGEHNQSLTTGVTIIVGRKGSVGEVHISLDRCWPIDTTYYIDEFYCQIPPGYWRLFLKSLRLGRQDKSSAIPGISREDIYQLQVPLPPLAEQRRIVNKLEMLLARVEACQQRLAEIPVILKRFRQAVLAAACSGRLTTDWREDNVVIEPNPCEKEYRIVDNELMDLPESWKLVSLESICDHIIDCPHSTPKWAESGYICVRTTNFKPGYLDLSEVRYVSEETYRERIQRLIPRAGDVLYSREGGILGIACIIPTGIEICLGQRMMLMRTNRDFLPQFLMYWLNSPEILKRVRDMTGGSASPHLNVRDVKEFPTPLPPLDEQGEIVRRVETLFKLAEQLETRYRKAKDQVEKLQQSIFTKAFCGGLVPTEAKLALCEGRDYETAEKLLERIRKERLEPNLNRKGNNSGVQKTYSPTMEVLN